MEEQYAICRVSVAPLRATPSDQSEIVSQLLFGEAALLLDLNDKWRLIRGVDDGYEGWVDFKQLSPVDSYELCQFLAPPQLNNTLIAEDGSHYYLAAGSNLPHLEDGYCHVDNQRFKLEFSPLVIELGNPGETITCLAHFFLNAPYLWGGRTLFGIDCSGFVQIVFKMAGLKIKRDASQQAEEGITVDFLPEALPGDVAFFDNEEGRIIHVGILLANDRIIHSSGKVKIDPIDDQGIYNHELQKYTHKLRIIKRFL